MSATVHLDPVGIEFEVEDDETILDAAFRQGIGLPHGCKEGQCSSCKCVLQDGEVDMLKYSTFALNESERAQNYILLCRSLALTDVTIELLNYDEEALSAATAVRDVVAVVEDVVPLTHDICRLDVKVEGGFSFKAGQYVDLTLDGREGLTRSYSMASSPIEEGRLSFIIKRYPNGRFSSRLEQDVRRGVSIGIRGPFGSCYRREGRSGPMVLVGGGSGMSPLWSILNDQVRSGERRPIHFFYGARTQNDLFYLDEIAALAAAHEVSFVPVLSDARDDPNWRGERGFVHEVVDRYLSQRIQGSYADIYACGPGPMIDALTPVLEAHAIDATRIFIDRFTPATP